MQSENSVSTSSVVGILRIRLSSVDVFRIETCLPCVNNEIGHQSREQGYHSNFKYGTPRKIACAKFGICDIKTNKVVSEDAADDSQEHKRNELEASIDLGCSDLEEDQPDEIGVND